VSITVTATQTGAGGTFNGMALTVRVLTGQAASPIGATASSGTVATPELAITPSGTGSWVYGAVANFNGSSGQTAASGTTFSQNVGDTTNGGNYGTFRSTSTTTSGTPVTLGATAPTGAGNIGIALLEILKGTGLAEDASSPAGVSTTSAITVTTASFTPPPGSLLVAKVASDSDGTANMTMTVSDTSGLIWVKRVAASNSNAAGTEEVATVWTAVVPLIAGGVKALQAVKRAAYY